LIAEPPNVRLNLPSRPENLMLVREVLAGVGEALELDPFDLDDIRTAVTEACGNVVMHAYDGGEGPLEVEIYLSADEIEVVVRDHGTGIQPRIDADEGEGFSGIGLLVIQALVHSVAFKAADTPTSRDGWDGTEVRMAFATRGARLLEASRPAQPRAWGEPLIVALSELADTTEITIAPATLARAVLPRLLSVLAARANFSTDRISDAQLIADAVARYGPHPSGSGELRLAIGVRPHNLELRIAPLHRGRGRRLIDDSAVDGLGRVLERLTDEQRVLPLGSSEMLSLRMADPA
jgi:serine/threonine-protein kinase RsbW